MLKQVLLVCFMVICVTKGNTVYYLDGQRGQCVCELETDYNGDDMAPLGLSPYSITDCCDYCYNNPECKSFTSVPSVNQCWPKKTLSGSLYIQNYPGRISCRKVAGSGTTTGTATASTSFTTVTAPTTLTVPQTTTPPAICLLTEKGVNYPGNDIGQYLIVKDQYECCALCKPDNGCSGWSYASVKPLGGGEPVNYCALKSAMGTAVTDSNWISGFSSADAQLCKGGATHVKASCTSYFVCKKDAATNKITATFVQCPGTLQFDVSTNKCNFASKVNCV